MIVAEDGLEALSALETNEVDLVLMEVQMPGMDGLTAARSLRKREQEQGRKRLLIVALTAHEMTGDREHCLAVGMDGYITKPIQVQERERVLSQVDAPTAPDAPAAN